MKWRRKGKIGLWRGGRISRRCRIGGGVRRKSPVRGASYGRTEHVEERKNVNKGPRAHLGKRERHNEERDIKRFNLPEIGS